MNNRSCPRESVTPSFSSRGPRQLSSQPQRDRIEHLILEPEHERRRHFDQLHVTATDSTTCEVWIGVTQLEVDRGGLVEGDLHRLRDTGFNLDVDSGRAPRSADSSGRTHSTFAPSHR